MAVPWQQPWCGMRLDSGPLPLGSTLLWVLKLLVMPLDDHILFLILNFYCAREKYKLGRNIKGAEKKLLGVMLGSGSKLGL